VSYPHGDNAGCIFDLQVILIPGDWKPPPLPSQDGPPNPGPIRLRIDLLEGQDLKDRPFFGKTGTFVLRKHQIGPGFAGIGMIRAPKKHALASFVEAISGRIVLHYAGMKRIPVLVMRV
jgi:hypothetical protein